MSASISISLAMSIASSKTPLGKSSTRNPSSSMNKSDSTRPKEISIYKGISERPLGWNPRRSARNPSSNPLARDIMMQFDGTGRRPAEWDAFRRDSELWFPDGDCAVYLYGYGQSQKGPAFKVPLSGLRRANCQPLLERFMVSAETYSPPSELSNNKAPTYSDHNIAEQYELYIPAPKLLERRQAFLYHTAVRNFFAWVFKKSLVGNHLGGTLVALLNSMNEFRDSSEDNIQAIMSFMDEEGYGDMKNQPDHALGILFFAEHFQFRDLWIDAFAHSVGMSEQICTSPGHEFISQPSRSLIKRARLEMDIRLENCSRRLETFLSDDLSDAGLSSRAHAHLDKFRSFLHSYFVGRLGYYPPTSSTGGTTFPANVYERMCSEFARLYEFLMDDQVTASDTISSAKSDGICVEKVLGIFDKRHKYGGLLHRLPLLPEDIEPIRPKLSRFGFQKSDRMKPNPRLLIFESLSKATNRKEHLLRCPLVLAYREFEKECAFSSSPLFVDKDEKLSQKEARKVRWILIYSILQILLSATRIPEQVTDIHNVPYDICVLTTDCPPWKEQKPDERLVSKESRQASAEAEFVPTSTFEIKPDIDESFFIQKPQKIEIPTQPLLIPESLVKTSPSKRGGTQSPQHSRSSWKLFPEIPVKGYGNGTNIVNINSRPTTPTRQQNSHARELSAESGSSSVEDKSFRWSNVSSDTLDTCSPSTSIAPDSRRSSKFSIEPPKEDAKVYPDGDSGFFDLERVPDSLWIEAVDESCAWEPEPAELNKIPKGHQFMQITTEVKVEWDGPKGNGELLNCLHNPNPCPMVVISA